MVIRRTLRQVSHHQPWTTGMHLLLAVFALSDGAFAQDVLTQRNNNTSGVTSKPAIEGHFKTGQRTSTLDDLFYLTGWRSGKCNLVQPIRCRQT